MKPEKKKPAQLKKALHPIAISNADKKNKALPGNIMQAIRKIARDERVKAKAGKAFPLSLPEGVSVLFSGASGTGKTLAAKILAAELGMDLYRVDLAAVINKYIGETEKNLHRVLSQAEELNVVLLLDEGDSLLGSRSEVTDANDRYANLESNTLLDRLEKYKGIVLLSTNSKEDPEPAFKRRFSYIVNFPLSDEKENESSDNEVSE